MGVFVYVGNRSAAIPRVYRASVGRGIAGCSAVAKARSVGAVEDQQPKPITVSAEVLVEPVSSHGRRADHAHRLVGLFFYLIAGARVPRLHAKSIGPRVAVAFAFDADQDGAGRMFVRLGILAGFILIFM